MYTLHGKPFDALHLLLIHFNNSHRKCISISGGTTAHHAHQISLYQRKRFSISCRSLKTISSISKALTVLSTHNKYILYNMKYKILYYICLHHPLHVARNNILFNYKYQHTYVIVSAVESFQIHNSLLKLQNPNSFQ